MLVATDNDISKLSTNDAYYVNTVACIGMVEGLLIAMAGNRYEKIVAPFISYLFVFYLI